MSRSCRGARLACAGALLVACLALCSRAEAKLRPRRTGGLLRSRTRATRKASSWFIPPPGSTFFWVLNGNAPAQIKAAVLDRDGFALTAAQISALKGAGKRVICYFSFGTAEDWRPDFKQYPRSVLGGKTCMSQNDAGQCTQYWPGERWVDVRSTAVRTILENRVKLAKAKGCDGIEPDNLDAYAANLNYQAITKFTITAADELNFLKWISATVHKYGMSVGLKNGGELAPQLVPYYDWALNEECNFFSDWAAGAWYQGKYQCDYLNGFVKAGKAAFVAEYDEEMGTSPTAFLPKVLCSDNNAHGFTTRLYDFGLTGKLYPFADCKSHEPAGCAAETWKKCIQPAFYKPYGTDPDMADTDMIGQCVRARAARYCAYV